jgi:SAM-dependent methyltransferase
MPAEKPIGRASELGKMPAHWMLAQMGKKVLRPGGIELTHELLSALAIDPRDEVVEFAPGLGVTAKLTLQRNPASYVAVERDEVAAARVRSFLNGSTRRCVVGNAQQTGLPDASTTVVYGEAMLTMQPPATKDAIVSEAVRLLRPGGRYGIHELALVPPDLPEALRAEISGAFGCTIHHLVQPLTTLGWRELLEKHGMKVQAERTAAMHLLEPKRVIRDEGLFGAIRFVFNVLRHKEARSRVLKLKRLFRSYRDNVGAIMLVAVRQ